MVSLALPGLYFLPGYAHFDYILGDVIPTASYLCEDGMESSLTFALYNM